MNTITMMNATATTISAKTITEIVNNRTDIMVIGRNGKLTMSQFNKLVNTVEDFTILDGTIEELALGGKLELADQFGKKVLTLRIIALSVKEKKKISDKEEYRIFGMGYGDAHVGSNAVEIKTAKAGNGMAKIMAEAGITGKDLASVSFAAVAANVNDSMRKTKIRSAIENGVVIYSGRAYVRIGGQYFALYWRGTKDNNVQRPAEFLSAPGVRREWYFPTFYTSSGRMNGDLFFIRNSEAADRFCIAAAGCTAMQLQHREAKAFWATMKSEGLFKKVAKAFKYGGNALGAECELHDKGFDDNAHIVIIDKTKCRLTDGGIFASSKSGLAQGHYQVRLFDTSAKGLMIVNDAVFNGIFTRVRDMILNKDLVIELGDKTKPVSVIMDTDSWKHGLWSEDPAHVYKHWLVHEFDEVPNKASISESQALKLKRMGVANMPSLFEAKIKEEAIDGAWDAMHPNPDSVFPLKMLAGLDAASTKSSVSMFFSSLNEKVKTYGFDAYVLPIISAPLFNDAEEKAVKAMNLGKSEFVAFAAPETARLIGKEGLAVRYPETGEYGKPIVHVVTDKRCIPGALYFAATQNIEHLKVVLTGADFDGDKVAFITVEDINGQMTELGEALKKSGNYGRTDCVLNDFSELSAQFKKPDIIRCREYMASDATGHEFLADSYSLDMNQVGAFIKANNIVKLSAEVYPCWADDVTVSYDWHWSWETDDTKEAVMTATEIRLWMNYVAEVIDLCGEKMIKLLTKTIGEKFRVDVGLVGNWCAELATAISTNGFGIPKDIRNWFSLFANKIVGKAIEADETAGKQREQAQLVADLGIGEDFSIREAAKRGIDSAREWADEKVEVLMGKPCEINNEEFTWLNKHGFWNCAYAAQNATTVDVWQYVNGSIISAMKDPMRKDGVDYLRRLAWDAGYKSRVMPWQGLVSCDYSKEDAMKVCLMEEYKDKAVLTFFLGNKGDYSGINAYLNGIDQEGKYAFDTIEISANKKGLQVDIPLLAQQKKVGLKTFTNTEYMPGAGIWTVDAIIPVLEKDDGNATYFVACLSLNKDTAEQTQSGQIQTVQQ